MVRFLAAAAMEGCAVREVEDAWGHLLLDCLRGEPAVEIIERDDGYMDTGDPMRYFAAAEDWPAHERAAMAEVAGRALDIGCGAGRHTLHLQGRGLEVVAIDVSPGAVEVCGARGVRDGRLLPVSRVGRSLGRFDAILMLGNNFGLVGDAEGATRLLRRFAALTEAGGCILAESVDPYRTDNPFHLQYHERNRLRGRMPGQLRLRVRHRVWKTPWFDYLFVSPEEMAALAAPAGWKIARVHASGGPQYVAVLRKGS